MDFQGKTILVTGGTGSFGKAFSKHILEVYPRIQKLIILSRDELKQYEMSQEITDERVRFFLGDVRDRERLRRAFAGVDIVVHAAALKQVPAGEYNPDEFIKTNVDGASNVVNAALDCGVSRTIALSTDKAVNPINLYGATKLCSDRLFMAANSYSSGRRSKFSVVRYGNVVGSRGSVVPYFKKLKALGQPLRITDPRMTRFWITLDQAVQFVVDSLGRMRGGEIFVPKIPTVGLVDLAKAIYPEADCEIVGIRPGEKLHEALISEDEARNTYEFETYFAITQDADRGMLCPEGFKYTSDTNSWQLSPKELVTLTNCV